jgi:GT2 family glycosyltransferase
MRTGLKKTVAALTINYKTDNLTVRCIQSLLKSQFDGNLIIAILDNGVDDVESAHSHLYKYFRSLSPDNITNPIIKVLYFKSEENLGYSRGINYLYNRLRNHGVDFYYTINNDAYVFKDTIKDLLDSITTYPNMVVSSLIKKSDGSVWFEGGVYNPYFGLSKHVSFDRFINSEKKFLTGCALMIPDGVINHIGFLDEDFFLYGEDLDYSMRLKKAGIQMHICVDSVVIHDPGSSAVPRSYTAYKYFSQSTCLAFYKHSSLLISFLIFTRFLLKSFALVFINPFRLKHSIGHFVGVISSFRYFFSRY